MMGAEQRLWGMFKLAFLLQIGSIILSSTFAFADHHVPDIAPMSHITSVRWNDDLQNVVKEGDGFLLQPEDISVDKEGTFYTGTRDGWIKRKKRNVPWQDWKLLGGNGVLGSAIANNGDLLVCDANKGLLRVNQHGAKVLVAIDGSILRAPNDVIEAWNGKIYFTDSSNPNGSLLMYHPRTNHTSILLSPLSIGNGVALSKHQDFLVVCETAKFRCLKYWLKGEKKGKAEIFIDNLPGGPDNINLAPDGSFWIALLKIKVIRGQVISKNIATKAMVVKVGKHGNIITKLDDSTGKVIAFVTSALEYKGSLYLGNQNSSFIGELKLN